MCFLVQPLFSDTKPDTFEDLYDTYFDRVNRYLRYRTPSVWDADDLTAAVFTRAFEKHHLYRGEAPVAVWLFRIAHNLYVDYMRSNSRYALAGSEAFIETAADGQPEDELLKSEELGQLRKTIETLSPDYRDVVTLRYAGELRFSQIARVLEKTESAVRMIHHRALKTLKNRLREEGDCFVRR